MPKRGDKLLFTVESGNKEIVEENLKRYLSKGWYVHDYASEGDIVFKFLLVYKVPK